MKVKGNVVNIIGAGFAGIECALFLADHGINVHIFDCGRDNYSCDSLSCEMFGISEENKNSARDLLRSELELLGSSLIDKEKELIEDKKVQCVAKKLLEYGLSKVKKHKRITFFNFCVTDLNFEEVNVVCTGPHTRSELFSWLKGQFGSMKFNDEHTIYPILQNVDEKKLLKIAKDDMFYIPLDYQQYIDLCNQIIKQRNILIQKGEKVCHLPDCIETMVAKDKDCLKNNVLRPLYLPQLDKKPYAVVKIRKDGQKYFLNGFASQLPPQAQYEIINSIPGLENCFILRTGKSYENSYINAPFMINIFGQSNKFENLFFAGNVAGVFGHIESMATGLYVAYNIINLLANRRLAPIPSQTCLGAIMKKIVSQNSVKFDPIVAKYDIIETDKKYKSFKEKKEDLFLVSKDLIEKYKEDCFNGKHI